MRPATRPARWSQLHQLVATVLAAVALTLGLAAPAAAHAELISTDPTEGSVVDDAPDLVTLTFNEPVRLTSQKIAVYDDQGDEVASTAKAVDAEVRVELPDAATLEDGTYVVAWNIVSADGHPIGGALTFSVGAPSATVEPPPEPESSSAVVSVVRDAATAVTLIGLLLASGLALFIAWMLPRSWPGDETRARLRRLTTYAAGLAVFGAVLQVPVASVYAQGAELPSLFTAFDPALVANEALAAAAVLTGLALVAATLRETRPGRRQTTLLTVGAALALIGPSLVGHSRAFAPVPLMMAADLLHVAAGAVWLGGLVGLVLSLRALSGREVVAARTLARFSTIAGGLLLAVAASGTFLGWRILGSWSPLVETAYGWLLLAKVAIALTVAGIGGWNRWKTMPAVQRAVGFADRERAARLVNRTVRVEAVLLVVLLAVTGALVNQSPRPTPVTPESGTTGAGSALAGDLKVLAVMDPQRIGSNSLLIQVQDETGEPYDAPNNPVVSLRTDGIEIADITLLAVGAGTYRGEVVVPRAGEWEVQVGIPLSRFENPVTTVRLQVSR